VTGPFLDRDALTGKAIDRQTSRRRPPLHMTSEHARIVVPVPVSVLRPLSTKSIASTATDVQQHASAVASGARRVYRIPKRVLGERLVQQVEVQKRLRTVGPTCESSSPRENRGPQDRRMSGGAARNNCVPTTLAPALSADAPSIKPVRGGEWKGPNENPFAPALRLLNSAAVLPCARTPDVIKKVSWAPGTKEGSVGRRRGCRRLSPLARSPEDVEKKEYWDDINRLNSEVKKHVRVPARCRLGPPLRPRCAARAEPARVARRARLSRHRALAAGVQHHVAACPAGNPVSEAHGSDRRIAEL